MSRNQSGIASLLILIAVVLLISSLIVFGAIYLKNHPRFSNNQPKKVDTQNKSSTESTKTNLEKTDIYEPGLYVHPKLNVVFNYPKDWKLSDKVIDNKGNLSLSFYLTDMKDKKWYEGDYLSVAIEKGSSTKISQFVEVLQKDGKGRVEKTIGTLKGNFYSDEAEDPYRYKEDFLAIYGNISFMFSLSIGSKDKDKFHKLFEDVISSVKGYDKTGYKLPDYLNDNLALDDKISAPSYLTPRFSILFEKQKPDSVEWWHSLDVTETGSGPNDLNVYEYRINSTDQYGTYSYTVNLENMLTRLKKFNPSAVVEPVTVKGYKGYHLLNTGLNDDPNKKYGDLIFITDKIVVNIHAGSAADASKEELIKIAESMIH